MSSDSAGISPGKGGVMPPSQTSSPSYTPAGSGSRPGPSKFPIETSAPADPRTMKNPPEGWLK